MQQEVSAQLIRFISGMIIVFHKRTLLGRQPAQVSRPQRKGNFPGRTIVGNQRALENRTTKEKVVLISATFNPSFSANRAVID